MEAKNKNVDIIPDLRYRRFKPSGVDVEAFQAVTSSMSQDQQDEWDTLSEQSRGLWIREFKRIYR